MTLPGATGPAAQIAAGWDSSLVVTTTGQLYAFGYNFYGRLGVATFAGTSTRISVPGESQIEDVSAGCGRASAVGKPRVEQVQAGADTLTLGGPALAPGRYEVTVTPYAGGQEGNFKTTRFTVTG